MRARNDVIFLSYAKILASIQDFGEKRIQSDVYKHGPILYRFVGVLLAVFPLGVNYYLALSNTANGYAYQTELKAMLEEWATQNTMHTVVLSAEMEQQEWATQEIRATGIPAGPTPSTMLTCILQMYVFTILVSLSGT
ncbi:hypothetical protein DSO57_1033517 [Entomophthora muscae]|uniref:Uncharacterized protein n=1 Tax=Entomophthora muscae TaxID=34485 RepID=A0ACC2TAV2_9FUNG|nr:hypothetical protein DSO57_1033517 [Entomophthora muscae]